MPPWAPCCRAWAAGRHVALPHLGQPAATSYTSSNSSVEQSDYQVALNVSYELDLAGRVRRQLENARAAQASRAPISRTPAWC
jgi:outer membrane protein TolC